METVIAWVIGIVVIGFLILFSLGTVIGVFINVFSKPDATEVQRQKLRGGLGKALVAGVLLGKWLDD